MVWLATRWEYWFILIENTILDGICQQACRRSLVAACQWILWTASIVGDRTCSTSRTGVLYKPGGAWLHGDQNGLAERQTHTQLRLRQWDRRMFFSSLKYIVCLIFTSETLVFYLIVLFFLMHSFSQIFSFLKKKILIHY